MDLNKTGVGAGHKHGRYRCRHVPDRPAAPAASQATSPGSNGKIAFASNEELFTIDPDGSSLTRVPTASCEGLEPDWAPDGHTIGFIERCGPSGTFDLSVVDVNGAGLRRIYATNRDDARIDWSPDGSQALFISDASGNREIYRSDAGFTQVVNLTNSPGRTTFRPGRPTGPRSRSPATGPATSRSIP